MTLPYVGLVYNTSSELSLIPLFDPQDFAFNPTAASRVHPIHLSLIPSAASPHSLGVSATACDWLGATRRPAAGSTGDTQGLIPAALVSCTDSLEEE